MAVWSWDRAESRYKAYYDADPEFTKALSLASLDTVQQGLMVYDSQVSDTVGCIDFLMHSTRNPTKASMQLPVWHGRWQG